MRVHHIHNYIAGAVCILYQVYDIRVEDRVWIRVGGMLFSGDGVNIHSNFNACHSKV